MNFGCWNLNDLRHQLLTTLFTSSGALKHLQILLSHSIQREIGFDFFRAASLICFLASRFRIKKSALAAAAAISLGGTYSPFALAAFSFPPPIQAIGDQ